MGAGFCPQTFVPGHYPPDRATLILRIIDSMRWFERKFQNAVEVEAFPSVVERLRGAPVRVITLRG